MALRWPSAGLLGQAVAGMLLLLGAASSAVCAPCAPPAFAACADAPVAHVDARAAAAVAIATAVAHVDRDATAAVALGLGCGLLVTVAPPHVDPADAAAAVAYAIPEPGCDFPAFLAIAAAFAFLLRFLDACPPSVALLLLLLSSFVELHLLPSWLAPQLSSSVVQPLLLLSVLPLSDGLWQLQPL